MKEQSFHSAITEMLGAKLKRFTDGGKSLNLVTCVEIYTTIFESLAEVITESETPVTNESVNYLAQQYYHSVLINNTQELDPDIFTRRADLKNIETGELALLATMLKDTDLALPVLAEIKGRS